MVELVSVDSRFCLHVPRDEQADVRVHYRQHSQRDSCPTAFGIPHLSSHSRVGIVFLHVDILYSACIGGRSPPQDPLPMKLRYFRWVELLGDADNHVRQ